MVKIIKANLTGVIKIEGIKNKKVSSKIRSKNVCKVRRQVEELKREVPKLVKEKNVEELMELAREFNFKEVRCSEPRFKRKELSKILMGLGNQGLLTIVFYIWAHPVIENDLEFCEDFEDLRSMLSVSDDPLLNHIADLMDEYYLSREIPLRKLFDF